MQDKQVKIHTLDNSLKLVYCEIPQISNIYFNFTVEAGSVYDPVNKLGLAHFVEHLISPNSNRLDLEMSGGFSSAHTQYNVCRYLITIIKGEEENAFDYFAKTIFQPNFNQKIFIEELKMIIQEQSLHPTPSRYESLLLKMFSNQLGIGAPRDGTKDSVSMITLEDAQSFYQEFYQPKNMTLSVAGTSDWNKLIDFAERNFAGFNSNDIDLPKNKPNINNGPNIFFTPTTNKVGSLSMIFFHDIGYLHEDRYKLRLLAQILNGRSNSIFSKRFRFGGKVSYTTNSINYLSKNHGFYYIYQDIETNDISSTLDFITNTFSRIKKSGPSEDELKLAKAADKVDWNLTYDCPEALVDYLATEVQMGSFKTLDEILNFESDYTTEDILKMATKNLTKENLGINITSTDNNDSTTMKIKEKLRDL